MGQLEQPYTITDQVDTQDGKEVTIPVNFIYSIS